MTKCVYVSMANQRLKVSRHHGCTVLISRHHCLEFFFNLKKFNFFFFVLGVPNLSFGIRAQEEHYPMSSKRYPITIRDLLNALTCSIIRRCESFFHITVWEIENGCSRATLQLSAITFTIERAVPPQPSKWVATLFETFS